MRRKTILVLGLTVLAMMVLVASGCGGDDNAGSDDVTTEAVVTEEETTTEEAVTEETTTEEAVTTEEDTPDLSDVASAENCKELAELSSKLSTAFTGTGAAGDIKTAAAVLNELAENAPEDIRADFKTYADFVTKVAAATSGLTPGEVPDAAKLQELQSLQADTAKVTAASQNISTWVAENCTTG